MTRLVLKVEVLPHGEGLELPRYATEGSVGLDLCAAVPEENPTRVYPGSRKLIPTGLRMQIPAGHEAQIRPRSGLARKHGVVVLNTPGTIDEDYRGEVKVLLVSHSNTPFDVERGMRIAQMVIAPVTKVVIEEGELDDTPRGDGGFGHTGL